VYLDTILFIIGGICAFLSVLLCLYLVISHKQSKAYRAVLQQETVLLDTLTTVGLHTRGTKSGATDCDETELLTYGGNPEQGGTSRIFEDDKTELLKKEEPETIDFDDSALESRYILKSEIHGGGMSRVFLAESAKLGNLWIVKFISNHIGELANEEKILKMLNHISLPKIADIFHDNKGVYIVESFIEGISLDKVLETGQNINEVTILDWAEQLAQVLNYLHRMEPYPVYHFDLKPSNIMVTHDNRLVLIDFGISKRLGESDKGGVGVTYQYAAPEQLKHVIPDKYLPGIEDRFGELPEDRLYWMPDQRTDIYSLGVILFELAVGCIPTVQNMKKLKDAVSHELCTIIKKCLMLNPDERYQSANELLLDLQKIKGSKVKIARTLFLRKLASVSTVFAVAISGGSLTGGYYINTQEKMALLHVEPEVVTVSLQQSSELTIEKQMPDGTAVLLDNSRIRWNYSRDNIARIDGNRISGINIGETELSGKYRNKEITLKVRVVEPMDGMVNISQRYQPGRIIKVFAGTTVREHKDGPLAETEFVSPESIAVADDGSVYVADSGLLRKIKDGYVECIKFSPEYLTPKIVRCLNNEVYILTNEWEDEDGVHYGIIRLTEEGAEGLYMNDAKYTAVEDFAFSTDGLIYFIDRNAGVGGVFLKTIDPENTDDIRTFCELPKGTAGLTMDENDVVYLANPETGVIQTWKDGKLSYFAGVENEKAFIDGTAPLFYMPRQIKYSNGFLFVWDFNTLRRITVKDSVASECITVAGEASPTFELDISETQQPSEDIILPNSNLMDFAVKDDGILLTDPKRGVIWRVE